MIVSTRTNEYISQEILGAFQISFRIVLGPQFEPEGGGGINEHMYRVLDQSGGGVNLPVLSGICMKLNHESRFVD